MKRREPPVFILGLGLIGGSLALALTASGHYRVVGCDRDAETLARRWPPEPWPERARREALAQAELVILAAPPQAAAAFLGAGDESPSGGSGDGCVRRQGFGGGGNAPLCRRSGGAVFCGRPPHGGQGRSAALTRAEAVGCSKGPAIL